MEGRRRLFVNGRARHRACLGDKERVAGAPTCSCWVLATLLLKPSVLLRMVKALCKAAIVVAGSFTRLPNTAMFGHEAGDNV